MASTICEECGLPKTEWKFAQGKGFERHGTKYCCQGCFLGIGCTCKETGVRRVVVVGQPEINRNKEIYVKKMDRQVREWQSKIAALEARAKERKADANPAIRREMDDLRKRVKETNAELAKVKSNPSAWPQGARTVSSDYRKMKEVAGDAGERIKKK